MKRISCQYYAIGILAILFIATVGCSSFIDISARPLYSIDKYDYNDAIRGTLYKSDLLIAKEIDSLYRTFVTLEKYVHRAQAMYSMDVFYVGPDWRYMDGFELTIDGEIITVTDDNPIRIRKTAERVTESLTCYLDEATFKSLRYCKSLVIQFCHKPIIIPQEGCEAIWNFLRE